MKKNTTNYYTFVLTLLLILINIFRNKMINIAPSINVSISTIIYPVSFLLIIIILKKYKFKEAKESILLSSLLVLLFYLVVSILCSIVPTTSSAEINNSLRETFTPNNFHLYNLNIYYPNLLALFASTSIFILTHYICITIYEVIEDNSNYFIAFMLALLLSFIIDQMLFVPLVNILDIYYGKMSVIDIIQTLTGNFFIVVIMTIILMFLYPLCLNKKERTIN